jgi:hypothetical protein
VVAWTERDGRAARVWTTPRSPDNQSRALRRVVDDCSACCRQREARASEQVWNTSGRRDLGALVG